MDGKREEFVETIPLEEVLDELGMTEEEFDEMVEQGFREFEEGKLGSFEQLVRECELA